LYVDTPSECFGCGRRDRLWCCYSWIAGDNWSGGGRENRGCAHRWIAGGERSGGRDSRGCGRAVFFVTSVGAIHSSVTHPLLWDALLFASEFGGAVLVAHGATFVILLYEVESLFARDFSAHHHCAIDASLFVLASASLAWVRRPLGVNVLAFFSDVATGASSWWSGWCSGSCRLWHVWQGGGHHWRGNILADATLVDVSVLDASLVWPAVDVAWDFALGLSGDALAVHAS